MSDWQYRKHYGRKPDGTEWSPWEDVKEGMVFYSPRTLLETDPDASGRIEFRLKHDPHCEYLDCELAVEDLGLCFRHLNEELDHYNHDDPWPDFHDEELGTLRKLY
jgi:hypothetical protein